MKQVQWIIQFLPCSPNYYSKVHLSREGKVTLCKQPVMSGSEIKECTPGFALGRILQDEIDSRHDSRTDKKGLYCLKCLKKAAK